MSDGSEDEWEDTVFVLELRGVFDVAAVERAVADGATRLLHVDSERPLVQIGGGLYAASWQSTVGTDLLLRESADQTLALAGCSDRRLVAEKLVILPKDDTTEPLPSSTQVADETTTRM